MKNLIAKYAEGNKEALEFLGELIKLHNIGFSVFVSGVIDSSSKLRGENLGVIWSDICGKDLSVVKSLFKNCPLEIIEEASSKRDNSSFLLVSDYI
jgi:hypothetical protein